MALTPGGCSCNNEPDSPRQDVTGDDEGIIAGRVVAMDGKTPIAGALVTIDGYPDITTHSDAAGFFGFDSLPSGVMTFRAAKEPYAGEKTEVVMANESTAVIIRMIPEGKSFAVAVRPWNWESFDGDFDAVQEILKLIGMVEGEHFDVIKPADLADLEMLRKYNGVFINCTSDPHGEDENIREAIHQFVEEGGRLYVSDWSFEYIEHAWPDAITFPEIPWIGVEGGYSAEVVDDGLADFLGHSKVALHFDLGAWVVIGGVGEKANVMVKGSYEVYAGDFAIKRPKGAADRPVPRGRRLRHVHELSLQRKRHHGRYDRNSLVRRRQPIATRPSPRRSADSRSPTRSTTRTPRRSA
ncbi:MAG: carboxypeptidase-like regulatory domain-containing protein [Deltaproteobacteria bacterium]|nr:carboxypeptidase-like regulatory domain-containing protein [Deltaproteobacteria bacterium]